MMRTRHAGAPGSVFRSDKRHEVGPNVVGRTASPGVPRFGALLLTAEVHATLTQAPTRGCGLPSCPQAWRLPSVLPRGGDPAPGGSGFSCPSACGAALPDAVSVWRP